ncbi:hypothetical protein LTR37_007859 [Vermiconidia calcicola]|uniref:Uncharacterized protein n=1 Tax=Vermiconidia calcicola TaxID=1690605 RepID=A0ACC3NC81_9PEZI|nr:hypothetical protein LTR37_007859 [Vermiconidia calcicola]
MLMSRDLDLWGQPPAAPRTRESRNPTLLFSWWCTVFAAVVIITRIWGRKMRSDVLFKEDWIMMLSLVPLLIRMGLIHVVLLYGTNNVETVGIEYTAIELSHRSTGARLVLAARIFYAMFIWVSKYTISEFLKRITIRIWRRSYERTLQGIRVFLIATFFAVVIATLCECQPFDHYWQVVPDPSPHCRQGYGNLITMGACDIITDILLIAFPIPIILQSGQTWKRKLQLTSLFSLSIILILVTAFRIPMIVDHRGRQQYRTVWASAEILTSTVVSNAVIIGSFLRDKGTKRNKYRSASVSDSIEQASVRRPTIALQDTGSDEDLFRVLGMRVPEHLRDQSEATPRPAPRALPAAASVRQRSQGAVSPDSHPGPGIVGETNSSDSDESLRKPPPAPESHHLPSPSPWSKQVPSLFDVGGLLEDGRGSRGPASRSRANTRRHSAHSLAGTVYTQDFAPSPIQSRRGSRVQDFPPPTTPQSRRGSRNAAMLHDFGGLLTTTTSQTSSGMDRYHGRRQSDSHIYLPSKHLRPAPAGIIGPALERRETHHTPHDAGGLLNQIPEGGFESLQRMLSDDPGEVPRRAPPRLQGQHAHSTDHDDYELADIGGLLALDREPDAAAAALQRATARGSPQESAPHTVPTANTQREHRWDTIDLQDSGGLLGK